MNSSSLCRNAPRPDQIRFPRLSALIASRPLGAEPVVGAIHTHGRVALLALSSSRHWHSSMRQSSGPARGCDAGCGAGSGAEWTAQ
jgi:hypothetical protein